MNLLRLHEAFRDGDRFLTPAFGVGWGEWGKGCLFVPDLFSSFSSSCVFFFKLYIELYSDLG